MATAVVPLYELKLFHLQSHPNLNRLYHDGQSIYCVNYLLVLVEQSHLNIKDALTTIP